MNFDENFEEVIDSLLTVPNLKSLYVNLEHEEQVDDLMKKMVGLEFLNGIPVEHEEHSQGSKEQDSFRSDAEEEEEQPV